MAREAPSTASEELTSLRAPDAKHARVRVPRLKNPRSSVRPPRRWPAQLDGEATPLAERVSRRKVAWLASISGITGLCRLRFVKSRAGGVLVRVPGAGMWQSVAGKGGLSVGVAPGQGSDRSPRRAEAGFLLREGEAHGGRVRVSLCRASRARVTARRLLLAVESRA